MSRSADRRSPHGGERETLRAYLDFHRETLALKCAGLSDDDLRRRTTPSSLTLLGLVRHMAEVERAWFRRVLDGQDIPWSGHEGTPGRLRRGRRGTGGGLRGVAGRDRDRP